MQRRAYLRLATAIFVALACAISLTDTAQAQFAPPAVSSVNPNTGPTSGGTTVTIGGAFFTGASAVQFGSNAATSFTVISSSQIIATSPAGSGTVDVRVTTTAGTSPINQPADQFTYVPAPTVTNVNPNGGPPSGGTTVIITGTEFSGATAVRFGSNAAASFTVNGPNQITAISPPGSGTVDVTVTTAGGTSATGPGDRFTYAGTATALSSSQNPSSFGQAVTFTITVTGFSPAGSVILLDGGAQVATATVAAGTATFTISSLAVGSHSLTAQYSGDPNNAASTSAVLIQTVNVPADSSKLRAMQVSVTPQIAQLSGQAIVGAIDAAIDAGFSDNPQTLTPNGAGFRYQIPLGQPTGAPVRSAGNGTNRTERSVRAGAGTPGDGIQSIVALGPGSLANGRYGGNGAPPGTRLIDMPFIPLPPGSGMPANGETQFSPDLLVVQFGSGTGPQEFGQRFNLALVTQQTIEMLGRTVYVFRIAAGQSVREAIGVIEAARLNVAVQPYYAFRLTQDQNPNADMGDPAQYIVNKLHFAEVHRITKGNNAVVAVIDSEIDTNQPNLAGTVSDQYNAGCDASSPHPHGTGMAGAIASHGQLLGVAPQARIIAICAFGGAGQPESSTLNIINGLNHAIARGARIVNMSFAGPRDPALAQALQIAREKGVLVIAAAGNGGPKSPPLYPGADPNVMAVTATDESDHLFTGANQGKYVTVAAPGVDILVPAPNGTAQFTTGTSVATANVSGVAALLIARRPSLTPEEIRAILVRTAKHLGSQGMNPQFGAGLVDPLKALELPVSYMREEDGVRRFLASPDASSTYVEEAFTALGYARDDRLLTKAPPPLAAPSRDWLAWIDVRGTNYIRNTSGSDLNGGQVNAIAGLTRKLTPNFLVGVLGGYEHFDYSSQAFNGVLKGEGWTTGAYLGWKLTANLRLDAGGAWSDILANNAAGIASGNFIGHRWLTTGGLTGTYNWRAFVLEPSARVFALWEHENAYTDSLGTLQTARNFSTGRASAGVKVIYPLAWWSAANLAPYVGLYGDYYFSSDDAAIVALTTVPLLQGWSARVIAGVAMTFARGTLSAGGEYGGIGSDNHIWTWRVRGSMAF
jgi:hypothetical protein